MHQHHEQQHHHLQHQDQLHASQYCSHPKKQFTKMSRVTWQFTWWSRRFSSILPTNSVRANSLKVSDSDLTEGQTSGEISTSNNSHLLTYWKINSQFKKNVVRLLLKEEKEKDPSCYNLFEGSQLSASVGEIFWEKTVQFDQRQVEWFICQSSVSSPPDHCER